jgi:hypothetical protein
MKKIKKFKKLKNKIKGLSIELDKNTTKLSDLDELDGVIEDFKKETDDRYEVDVNIDIIKGSLELKRVRKPYLTLVKK